MKKILLLLLIPLILLSLYARGDQNEHSEVAGWDEFIELLVQKTEGKELQPFRPVGTLVQKYLWQVESESPVLDIGCETGKNAIHLIQAGHRVVLLDISPKAIQYTQENLKKKGLEKGISDSIVGNIETLDEKHGPFKAVIGTYVFSFIPPERFEQIMKEKVLNRVEPGGYFVGGFYGEEHGWAGEPSLGFFTSEQLEEFFISHGFTICEIQEKKRVVETIPHGETFFHTIEVIAKRNE